jgi:hypothetical protein
MTAGVICLHYLQQRKKGIANVAIEFVIICFSAQTKVGQMKMT